MKKNVLFLITDDQRFDTIHALGNPEISTPNMDKLVERGTSFTDAFIPGGTSGAVCMPSRAMINTGKFLTELTEVGDCIPDDHPVLGECLKNAGYETCGIGKWHNGPRGYSRAFTRGGDIFFGGMWDHWNVPINDFDETGDYSKLKTFTMDPFASNRKITLPAEKIHLGKHSTDLFSDKIIEEITEMANQDKPFFIYGSYLAPHDPRTMPDEFKHMYDPKKITLPDNFLPDHPFGFDIWGERDETLEAYPRDPEKVRQHIADYYAMISHIDSRLGDILNTLDEQGIADDTLIVFCGDNGLSIGQHGLMGKQNLYDNSIRIPLIFAGPGIPKNTKIDKKVLLFDLMPTILEYAGVEVPENVTAQSLLPLIQTGVGGRDELYLMFTTKIRGLVTDSYKLIEYRTKDGNFTQLFDRKLDPYEMVNLAYAPENKAIIEELRVKLIAYAKANGDTEYFQGQEFWKNYEAAVNEKA
jgi:arylsulfatase A-like enzyme